MCPSPARQSSLQDHQNKEALTHHARSSILAAQTPFPRQNLCVNALLARHSQAPNPPAQESGRNTGALTHHTCSCHRATLGQAQSLYLWLNALQVQKLGGRTALLFMRQGMKTHKPSCAPKGSTLLARPLQGHR